MGESKQAARGASQRRSRERREQLLRAALDVLERGGVKAVTHRAVSEAAGLPPATAAYYFPTVTDLTTAALGCHMEQRVAWLRALGAEFEEQAARQTLTATDLAAQLAVRRDDLMVADFEALLEAARNPAFRPATAAARHEVERSLGSVLRHMGATDGAPAARLCLALLTGFGLQQLAFGSEEVTAAPVADALTAIFTYALATVDEREQIRRSLRAPLAAPLQPTAGSDPATRPASTTAAGRGAGQHRSRERRDQLLRAALCIFESGGAKAITHRAVSHAAGLPPATAGYYFTTIEELLIGAAEFRGRQRLEEIAVLVQSFGETVGSPLDLIERVAHALVHEGHATSTSDIELYLEAARDRRFRAVAAAGRRDVEAMTVGYASQLGARDAVGGAHAYLAVTDGLALEHLACGGDDDEDARLLVEALVALGHFYLGPDVVR
jgi:DNA-binding transcriptional regulator YbjK